MYILYIRLKQVLVGTYLFVSLENSSESSNLLSLGAKKRLQFQHFLQEALCISLCLHTGTESRVRHCTSLTTEVHRHLGIYGNHLLNTFDRMFIDKIKDSSEFILLFSNRSFIT